MTLSNAGMGLVYPNLEESVTDDKCTIAAIDDVSS
jgi:hypothetical protein